MGTIRKNQNLKELIQKQRFITSVVGSH